MTPQLWIARDGLPTDDMRGLAFVYQGKPIWNEAMNAWQGNWVRVLIETRGNVFGIANGSLMKLVADPDSVEMAADAIPADGNVSAV